MQKLLKMAEEEFDKIQDELDKKQKLDIEVIDHRFKLIREIIAFRQAFTPRYDSKDTDG